MHRYFVITLTLLTISTSFSKTWATTYGGLSCDIVLSDFDNLDTVVELTTQGDYGSETRLRTLYLYIMQTNPNFLAPDYERVIHFIFTENTFTYYSDEPTSIWQFIAEAIGRNQATVNSRINPRDLSMESQILIWILNRYLNDLNSVTNAILVGNIHRYILNDIKRLQPNQDKRYYQIVFDSVLTTD